MLIVAAAGALSSWVPPNGPHVCLPCLLASGGQSTQLRAAADARLAARLPLRRRSGGSRSERTSWQSGWRRWSGSWTSTGARCRRQRAGPAAAPTPRRRRCRARRCWWAAALATAACCLRASAPPQPPADHAGLARAAVRQASSRRPGLPPLAALSQAPCCPPAPLPAGQLRAPVRRAAQRAGVPAAGGGGQGCGAAAAGRQRPRERQRPQPRQRRQHCQCHQPGCGAGHQPRRRAG
jgi:hypothetical protein